MPACTPGQGLPVAEMNAYLLSHEDSRISLPAADLCVGPGGPDRTGTHSTQQTGKILPCHSYATSTRLLCTYQLLIYDMTSASTLPLLCFRRKTKPKPCPRPSTSTPTLTRTTPFAGQGFITRARRSFSWDSTMRGRRHSCTC